MLLTYDRLRRSPFIKNVTILSGGTALARAVPILTSPILTRLYTPTDFGIMAVFIALVSALIPSICGKYEVAIVLPKSHRQGLHILGISLRIALIVSLVILLVVLLFRNPLLTLLNAQQLGGWIFLFPPALLFAGVMIAMSYFANRLHEYKNIAKGQMVNSLAVVSTTILLGVLGAGFGGLIGGWMVGTIVSTSYMLHLYRTRLPSDLLVWGQAKKELMKRYKDYPIYNASGGLLNGVTAALPIFFLTHNFPSSMVGLFSLGSRVVNTPLSVIAASVSQVNLKKIADLLNEKEKVRPYLLNATIGLISIVLLPAIIFTVSAPQIFSVVFGAEWREAGLYLQILMPAVAVQFVASTLSTTLDATENNRLGAVWHVIAFIVTIAVFAVYAPRQDAIALFKAVMVAQTALYIFYYALIWHAAGNPRSR